MTLGVSGSEPGASALLRAFCFLSPALRGAAAGRGPGGGREEPKGAAR